MEHVIRNRIGHLFLMGFGKYDLIRLNGLIRSRSFGPRGPVASPNGAPALAKCFPSLRLSLSRQANLSPAGSFTPVQSASTAFAVANPFRHLPSGSNPKRLKSSFGEERETNS